MFICLNLSHRLIVSEVLYQESFYGDYRRIFWRYFEIVCPLSFFYVDLQCPLISGRCNGRELKGRNHSYAHARRLSLENKFVGSTLNSKSPLLVQSLKILCFIPTSVALAGLAILW